MTKRRSDTLTRLYRLDAPQAGVVNTLTALGTFDVRGRATAADATPDAAGWTFAGHELCKVFPGVTDHLTDVTLPIVDNDQDMPRLAAALEPRLATDPPPPAYLIRGHGLYGWGRDLDEAERVVRQAIADAEKTFRAMLAEARVPVWYEHRLKADGKERQPHPRPRVRERQSHRGEDVCRRDLRR